MSSGRTERRRAEDLEPDAEMWEALERGAKLTRVLEDFYDRVYSDPELGVFFAGIRKEFVREKQWSFMAQLFTGEKLYFGDRPRNAHHWMVISDALFDRREELLAECLRRHGLPEHLVERWRAIDEVFRKQIVKDAPRGKKVRGVELAFEGYEPLALAVGSLCDGCTSELPVGARVSVHVRTGRTLCAECRAPEVGA